MRGLLAMLRRQWRRMLPRRQHTHVIDLGGGVFLCYTGKSPARGELLRDSTHTFDTTPTAELMAFDHAVDPGQDRAAAPDNPTKREDKIS